MTDAESTSESTIESARFRSIFGALPTTVAVVTTRDVDGYPRGVTTNTVTAVSPDPAMLSVCLDRGSTTLAALRTAGAFAVNFLAESGAGISRVFAAKDPDKFARVERTATDGIDGAPIFAEDVVAHAECTVHSEIVVGDHSIIVGLVRGGSTYERSPLMYYRRDYSTWRPDRVA